MEIPELALLSSTRGRLSGALCVRMGPRERKMLKRNENAPSLDIFRVQSRLYVAGESPAKRALKLGVHDDTDLRVFVAFRRCAIEWHRGRWGRQGSGRRRGRGCGPAIT